MRKLIPFIIMAFAIVVANNLFAKDTDTQKQVKAQDSAPQVVEAAPRPSSGCGCGR